MHTLYGMGHKKFLINCFIKTVFIRATEQELLGHGTVRSTSVQQLIKRSIHFQRCLRVLPTKQFFFFLKLVHMLFRVSCVCKSGKACCYFLGYKMSLWKTMNDKSCVSCKEDDHARVFCLAIVPLCLYFNKNLKYTCRLAEDAFALLESRYARSVVSPSSK